MTYGSICISSKKMDAIQYEYNTFRTTHIYRTYGENTEIFQEVRTSRRNIFRFCGNFKESYFENREFECLLFLILSNIVDSLRGV